MRVLVTGATGFIGRHLVAELCERGHDVIALARKTSNTSVLPEGVDLMIGDMTRADTLAEPAAAADAVVHLAALLRAPWRDDFVSANAGGIENIARACAESPTPPVLVIVSSLAAGGPVELGATRDESMPAVPVSRYGRAKLAGERAARVFADRVPMTIVRPPIVFGEYDHNSLPLFRGAARGLVVAPVRGPAPVSVVHGRDLAAGLVLALEDGERATVTESAEGLYYAPGAAPLDFLDFSRAVGQATGRSVVGLRLPKAVTWLAAAATEGLGRLTRSPKFLSLDKFREATGGSWACSGDKLRGLGFEPAPLEQRLQQTADWYRDAGLI